MKLPEIRFICYLVAVLAGGYLPATHVGAQMWPDRPVKLVLSQPAGSGTDNVARLLSDRLSKSWGQPIVIENKPGGQNTIGATAVARAAPDGYTFYFSTTAALVTNPLLFKTLTYDPQKDFTPVIFVARSPFAVLVEASSPIKSIDELIATSKKTPGKLTVGIEGPRTFSGMIARLFNARTGAQTNPVSYSSVAVGMQDLMGKHIDAMVTDLASTSQFIKQGRMRVLATTASKRVAGWEHIPSLSETIPGFDMVGWFAVVAPTGTPAAAINRFNRDVGALLAEKDISDRIATIGPISEANVSVEQTAQILRNETLRWTAITQEVGILPE
jgi:tripartite-type tricarboxylate transporter receptor subunit TctC